MGLMAARVEWFVPFVMRRYSTSARTRSRQQLHPATLAAMTIATVAWWSSPLVEFEAPADERAWSVLSTKAV